MHCVEEEDEDQPILEIVAKKRGRKSKQEIQTSEPTVELETDTAVPTKKRGRKPKGGKIVVSNLVGNMPLPEDKPNIILHLKCSSKDLLNNATANDKLEIESYNFASKNELSYDIIHKKEESCSSSSSHGEVVEEKDTNNNMKDVWTKLKRLEHILHTNNLLDKRSACFWCTCEFDNPSIYIPKQYTNNTYHVYGCFCSPECGVAYLMNETIDSSVRFERYQFMNNLYGKIFNYEKNIKPAPNPHYMLEKFCGNLTIQEYRSLLRNERLFLIVDKPLTRILPELHEDNDDFILNTKIIPSNYQMKRKQQIKKGGKTSIVNEHFGIMTPN
jgi:hypothetical protein